MSYQHFDEHQLYRAKNADIINFLESYYGYTFKKSGKYFSCKEHDSLVIFPDRKGFFWNSRGIKGGDVIDFLCRVEGRTFAEAVGIILNQRTETTEIPSDIHSKPEQLILPQKTKEKYSRVYAYLSKIRAISPIIIADFIKENKIYQDIKGNCVFVGFDENGIAKFGTIRGTLTNRKYRGDCKNSDKRYAFCQIGANISDLFVFESPIDLLSHCTIANIVYKNDYAYRQHTRLALCGSSDVALEAFLKRYTEVTAIHFRLDNDETGHSAVNKYSQKYISLGYKVNARFSKNKDINEDLVKMDY